MDIRIEPYTSTLFEETAQMITDLMNHHRKLTNARKEFWQTMDESKKTLEEWLDSGHIYNVFYDDNLAGFFYIRFGGQSAAWLEDLFIKEEFRSLGIGKEAFKLLDDMLTEKGTRAMFVNVIPRNIEAIKFYKECGFDHLNMVELRKNYDKTLDKTEEIDLLGFKFIKY